MPKNEYMPLGSMLNSFGLINKGKGMSAEDFIDEAEKIYRFAQKIEHEKEPIEINNKPIEIKQ